MEKSLKNPQAPLHFRPHHFLCALGFEGAGYSPRFIQNFAQITKQLNAPSGKQTLIEVVDRTDSICTPCPHRREDLCNTQEKIQILDQAHAKILHLKNGMQLTWGEARERIQQHMTLEKFKTACAPCEWQKSGICERKLHTARSGN
ncbi:MAG: DUF1284 domain-containing protein [Gammaproteobacteria bacterium]|nr:DUF1284 domain-containing protein [Gammaproteobacteria bacterium]